MSEITRDELIQKWLKALRSGTYTQDQGYLHRIDVGHCCLGVICEEAIEAGIDIGKKQTGFSSGEVSYNEDTGVLPEVLCCLLEIDNEGIFVEPISIGERDFQSLVQMNDAGVPFSVIANVIEETFKNDNFAPYYRE